MPVARYRRVTASFVCGGIGLRHRPEPLICSLTAHRRKSNSAGETLVKLAYIRVSVARSSGRSKSHAPTSDRLRNNGRTHVRLFFRLRFSMSTVNPLVHSVFLKGRYKKLDVRKSHSIFKWKMSHISHQRSLATELYTVYLENKSHALMG